MKTIPNKLTENVTPAPVGSSDLLGSVIRGRAEWLELLHKCQNGEATCLFVLKEMEAEMDRQREDYEADYARAVAALPNNRIDGTEK